MCLNEAKQFVSNFPVMHHTTVWL